MNYVLDTNVVSDILNKYPNVLKNLAKHQGQVIYLCEPVYYEILRGIIRKNATRQMLILNTRLRPKFVWASIIEQDWVDTAYLWAKTVSSGKQLSDMDLLIASISQRLNAILVTSDKDFLDLGLSLENWRVE